MTRVQLALDMTPQQLAKALDVPLADVLDRQGSRANMSSCVHDPFWNALSTYTDQRIAGMIALKDELDRKARLDWREYTERQRAIKGETKP